MIRKVISVILLSFIMLLSAVSQESSMEDFPLPADPGEQLNLFTDRSMYLAAGEILFTVHYRPPVVRYSREWSKVIYVELLNHDMTRISQSIVPVKEGMASGKMQIPREIYSGTYFLRAYTHWMRNYSPERYPTLPVTLVNPASPKIVPPGKNNNSEKAADSDLIERAESVPGMVEGLRNQYEARQEVVFTLQPEAYFGGSPYAVSVVRVEAAPANLTVVLHADESEETAVKLAFLPELSGLTLSGQIVEEDGTPVGGTRVNLSSFTKPFYYYSTVSDSEGKYCFVLPDFEGAFEFCISEDLASAGDHEILVTGQFDRRKVQLPYKAFQPVAGLEEYIGEAFIDAQLEERFLSQNAASDMNGYTRYAFYGAPRSVTYVKEFIELKDLGEFFFELVPSVSVVSTDAGEELKVNSQGSLGMFPPLVLMDNVRVPNNDALLRIPSRRVERIEVIDQGYLVGKEKFSGIVAIYSNDKDLAGYLLPTENQFFNYTLYGSAYEVSDMQHLLPGSAYTPDRRHLLYWNPGVPANGSEQVTLQTSDVPGTYAIVLQGLNATGERRVIEAGRFRVE